MGGVGEGAYEYKNSGGAAATTTTTTTTTTTGAATTSLLEFLREDHIPLLVSTPQEGSYSVTSSSNGGNQNPEPTSAEIKHEQIPVDSIAAAAAASVKAADIPTLNSAPNGGGAVIGLNDSTVGALETAGVGKVGSESNGDLMINPNPGNFSKVPDENSNNNGSAQSGRAPQPPSSEHALPLRSVYGSPQILMPWAVLLDSGRGEYALRWGPILKRKTYGLVTDIERELLLTYGRPEGPRLLYLQGGTGPQAHTLRASIDLLDTELEISLRGEGLSSGALLSRWLGFSGGGLIAATAVSNGSSSDTVVSHLYSSATPPSNNSSSTALPVHASSSTSSSSSIANRAIVRVDEFINAARLATAEAVAAEAKAEAAAAMATLAQADAEAEEEMEAEDESARRPCSMSKEEEGLSNDASKTTSTTYAPPPNNNTQRVAPIPGGSQIVAVSLKNTRSASFDSVSTAVPNSGNSIAVTPLTTSSFKTKSYASLAGTLGEGELSSSSSSSSNNNNNNGFPTLSGDASAAPKLSSPSTPSSFAHAVTLGTQRSNNNSPTARPHAGSISRSSGASFSLADDTKFPLGSGGELSAATLLENGISSITLTQGAEYFELTGHMPTSVVDSAAETGRRNSMPALRVLELGDATLAPTTTMLHCEQQGQVHLSPEIARPETTLTLAMPQESQGLERGVGGGAAGARAVALAATASANAAALEAATAVAKAVAANEAMVAASAAAVNPPVALRVTNKPSSSSSPSKRHERGKFDIKTGSKSSSRGKVYYFYDVLGAAKDWKDAIEAARKVFTDSKA